jgi:ATP-dependent DNA ligase
MPTVLRFIEPCLPSPADKLPSGSNWIHEIKHDGFRLMARRGPVGIRLITRRGNDWTQRWVTNFPRDASYLTSVSGESHIALKGNVGLRVTW